MSTLEGRGIPVRARHDRFGHVRKVFGVMPFAVKVASQDEWFYVVSGTYVVEVGGELHHLAPGDAVLAPRGVPHGWALDGTEPGRMLIAFQPAGTMEAFFDTASQLPGMPSPEAAAPLFEAHGMTIVGPPLRTP